MFNKLVECNRIATNIAIAEAKYSKACKIKYTTPSATLQDKIAAEAMLMEAEVEKRIAYKQKQQWINNQSSLGNKTMKFEYRGHIFEFPTEFMEYLEAVYGFDPIKLAKKLVDNYIDEGKNTLSLVEATLQVSPYEESGIIINRISL